MKVEIVATQEVLEKIKDVRRRVFIDEQGVPAEEEFDKYDALGNSTIFAVEDGGDVVGTARLVELGDGVCKYQRIAIDKQLRGKGAGRLLLEAADSRAKSLDCTKVLLDAQLHAIPFYEKCGFCVVDDTPFYDGGILHKRMEKWL